MKRARSDSLVAGFSLIEAMAALALTAIIILALSSVAGQWLPNWRRGFVDLQRADLLGIGLCLIATAIVLFGFQSGAALATVVGVLVEVPVMLSVVHIVRRSRGWYESA